MPLEGPARVLVDENGTVVTVVDGSNRAMLMVSDERSIELLEDIAKTLKDIRLMLSLSTEVGFMEDDDGEDY